MKIETEPLYIQTVYMYTRVCLQLQTKHCREVGSGKNLFNQM